MHKGHKKVVQKLIDNKVGFVNLHYTVEYLKSQSDHVLAWLGGCYETGFSTNPHWMADIKELPTHPITREVKLFRLFDEWYFNIRFQPTARAVTPILKTTPSNRVQGTDAARKHPGCEKTLGWAFERADGGRWFGFTGGHHHKNWGDENFRRLLTKAILWTAGQDIPDTGAPVALEAADLNRNLDRKFRR